MAKTKTVWICNQCGNEYAKWQGKCNACEQWNTIVEYKLGKNTPQPKIGITNTHSQVKTLDEIASDDYARVNLKDDELNRVLGGGLVPGSVVLLAGEPGIGKSTLLLQNGLKFTTEPVLYISGEESERQVKLRAERLEIRNPQFFLYAETDVDAIINQIIQILPCFAIIDSIQTLHANDIDSPPGSMNQIRECTMRLIRASKSNDISIFIVGHINKDGMIAGPKILEHMVDVVLEFEGERHNNYRIVRSLKNRFGSTPELGIYEMLGTGLREVTNPSELFLSENAGLYSGIATAATLQGLRPLLIEVQALVADSNYPTPQRASTGIDPRRLTLINAVLEKKCGLKLGTKDIFINLAGGIKVEDPALDLSVAISIASSFYDFIIPPKTAFAAEVSLTGELRPVTRLENRIAEAHKLGFESIFLAERHQLQELPTKYSTLNPLYYPNLQGVIRQLVC